MIISHAPNERYRSGWDRIYNKESVMEYTDCDNCARLEAENADLENLVDELQEQLYAVKDAVEVLNDTVDGI